MQKYKDPSDKKDLLPFQGLGKEMHEIKIIGIGGGGCNAVNHMYTLGITNVTFIVCNTDKQALEESPVPIKVKLGEELCDGKGAGCRPEVGREAAQQSLSEIEQILDATTTSMVFITAGMGGGTGTGAAPVIAELCRSKGYLTVGIVTIPFLFEGKSKIFNAIDSIDAIAESVDSLLIINNQRLLNTNDDLTIREAFKKTDNVLQIAVKSIADIINRHYVINVDFADVRTVMENGGPSIMGSGKSKGENRTEEAFTQALDSPLLNANKIGGAKHILFCISGHPNAEPRISELDKISKLATKHITGKNPDKHIQYMDINAIGDCNVIWAYGDDASLEEGELQVIVIATNFEPKENSGEKNFRRGMTISDKDKYEQDKLERISSFYELNKQTGKAKSPYQKIFNELTVEELRNEGLIGFLETQSAYNRLKNQKSNEV